MDTGGSWPSDPTAPPAPEPAPDATGPADPMPHAAAAASAEPAWPYAPPARRLRSRPIAWIAAVVAVAGAVGTVGVVLEQGTDADNQARSSSSGQTRSADPDFVAPNQEVAAVLARRTAALRSGDKEGFLADVDPTNDEFLADQARLFDNLRLLPLARASWEQNADHEYAAATTGVTDGAPTYVPAVQFSYRLRGFDRRPVPTAMALTFVQRGGAWVITADDDVSTLRDDARPAPWDVARIAVARTANVLVIGAPKDKGQLKDLARQTEAAIDAVDQMWSQTDLRTAVVYVPRDKTSLDAYFPKVGTRDSVFDGVEFPVYDRVTGWFDSDVGEAREAGNRVVINTRTVKPGSRSVPVLLRHEVAHVATSRWTEDGAPTWLVEGAAEYTAYRLDPYGRRFPPAVFSAAARGELIEKLPSNREFYGLRTGYDRAYLLCYYITLTYGEGKLVALYRKTGDIEKEILTADQVKKDIRSVLGVSQGQLLKDVNAWADTTIRPA